MFVAEQLIISKKNKISHEMTISVVNSYHLQKVFLN